MKVRYEILNKIYKNITSNALKLQLGWERDINNYRDNLILRYDDILQTDKEYGTLCSQNDLAMAKLYKLEFNEFLIIFKSFKVLSKKQSSYI